MHLVDPLACLVQLERVETLGAGDEPEASSSTLAARAGAGSAGTHADPGRRAAREGIRASRKEPRRGGGRARACPSWSRRRRRRLPRPTRGTAPPVAPPRTAAQAAEAPRVAEAAVVQGDLGALQNCSKERRGKWKSGAGGWAPTRGGYPRRRPPLVLGPHEPCGGPRVRGGAATEEVAGGRGGDLVGPAVEHDHLGVGAMGDLGLRFERASRTTRRSANEPGAVGRATNSARGATTAP